MDNGPEIDLPGLGALRTALATARKRLPTRRRLVREATAGLTTTIGSVPDGMANGLLAGVNPVYGLYANMVAPIAGGGLSSSTAMVINSTSAGALIAGQALASVPSEQRADALFLMVILAGLLQVVFGVLRFGRLTRFISYSVMTGFVAGIAVVLVLSQLPTVTGYDAEGDTALQGAIDLAGHVGSVHLPTLALAALTIAVGALLQRTPLNKAATLLALVVPTLVVAVAGLDSVAVVGDVGKIDAGFPIPSLPALSAMSGAVVTGAISVAIIAAVQGAAISQSLGTAGTGGDGASRDLIAQGAANAASGVFRGLPVGGSLKGTVLNLSSGGKERWSVILSGVWMIAVVVALSSVITTVAMPALGALLILVSASSIKPHDIAQVWHAGWPARVAAGTTFACTLFLPIQAAVAIGVALAGLLHVTTESTDISIVQLVERPDGTVEEMPAPDRLPPRTVTVLDVYGSLFYAGARTFERMLPRPDGDRSVVVLRLRGRTSLGATVIDVLTNYAERLSDAGGRLYLSGVSADAHEQLATGHHFADAGIDTYEAEGVLGVATRRAAEAGEAWLLTQAEATAKEP